MHPRPLEICLGLRVVSPPAAPSPVPSVFEEAVSMALVFLATSLWGGMRMTDCNWGVGGLSN